MMKKILSADQKEKKKVSKTRTAKERQAEVLQHCSEKPVKKDLEIIGYGFEREDCCCVPIFASERKSYKGVIFSTSKEAKEAFDDRRK